MRNAAAWAVRMLVNPGIPPPPPDTGDPNDGPTKKRSRASPFLPPSPPPPNLKCQKDAGYRRYTKETIVYAMCCCYAVHPHTHVAVVQVAVSNISRIQLQPSPIEPPAPSPLLGTRSLTASKQSGIYVLYLLYVKTQWQREIIREGEKN